MMNDRRPAGQVPAGSAGLCGRCRHVQVVRTERGGQFFLCRLSFTDPRFPRYPPTPVLRCGGFSPVEPEGEGGGEEEVDGG